MKNGSSVPTNKYIIIRLGVYKIGTSIIIYKWFSDINIIWKEKECLGTQEDTCWLYDSLTVFFVLVNKIVLKILLLFKWKKLSDLWYHERYHTRLSITKCGPFENIETRF